MKKIFTLFSLFSIITVQAQDGTLDLSFGTSGKTITVLPGVISPARTKLVAQADGKLLVPFTTDMYGHRDFGVARFHPDGTLDASFGGSGYVVTTIGTEDDITTGIAIQNDGKIVVVGASKTGSNSDFAAVRYNNDGSLDNGVAGIDQDPSDKFGTNGIVKVNLGGINDHAYAIAIQANEKIVIAGNSDNQFGVIRLHKDGTLDNTFNGTGVFRHNFGGSIDLYALLIQPNKKILIGGNAHSDCAIIRLNEDGSLDTEFNGTGVNRFAQSSGSDYINSLALQADGKILTFGRVEAGGPPDFGISRLNQDGTLDNSFDNDGIVIISAPGFTVDEAFFGAAQQDGKILVSGYSMSFIDGSTTFTVFRLNADGSLDDNSGSDATPGNQFGTAGFLQIDIGPGSDLAYGSMISQGNDLIIAGYAANGGSYDIGLAKIRNSSPIFIPHVVLPVSLVHFEANLEHRTVLLKWKTSAEVNFEQFEIQKGKEGQPFVTIGIVKGKGESAAKALYTFSDPDITPGTYFYRLKQVDTDGKYNYSKTVVIKYNAGSQLYIYPNPSASNTIFIATNGEANRIKQLKLLDASGKLLKTISVNNIHEKNISIDISNLNTGIYFIQAIGNQTVESVRFVKR